MPTASRQAEMDSVSPAPTYPTSSSDLVSNTAPHRNRDRRPATEIVRHRRVASHRIHQSERPRFDPFAAAMKQELAPATLLENVLVDRVILAAWRLQQMSQTDMAQARSDLKGGRLSPIGRHVLRAESSLETALLLLESARRPRWGKPAHMSTRLPAEVIALHQPEPAADLDAIPDLSNEWPRLPESEVVDDHEETCFEPDFETEPDTDADNDNDNETESDTDTDPPADAAWRGRLVFDDNVSTVSPVVRGTWVTVQQVVTLIVDGWTWSDVLHTHPELTEADIRACLAYTVEQDDSGR